MDAVEFIRERNRMCDKYWKQDGDCDGCPMIDADVECNELRNMIDCADKAVKVIEQWSREHPRKTRQSVFLKMFPHVRLNDKGQPWFCPRTLDTAYHPVGGCVLDVDICQRCKDKFWGQEVE